MTPLLDRIADWARVRPGSNAYTFIDFLGGDIEPRVCTWGEVHERSVRLAQRLCRFVVPGERVAILAPSGVEYVLALIASWYAGAIAVPLFAPGLPGHAERLAASFEDCDPSAVVTVAACAADVRAFVGGSTKIIIADESGATDDEDTGWRPGPAVLDDVAYLQYSSGSTRLPAGVEITHRNLTANVDQLVGTLTGGRPHITGVNWLPLFHDMGLLASVAVPLRAGTDAVLFDPVAFLMQPARWLRLLSGRPDAYTAAPNFAYDYCLRRLEPADLDGLDLSGVFLWLNGAEPVRAATLDRFAERLSGVGLDRRALCPAYGLAEATVYVAGHGIDRPPRTVAVDRDRLAAGEAVPAVSAAGEAVPAVSAAGEAVPAEGAAGEAVPAEGAAGEAVPAVSAAGEAVPAVSAAGQSVLVSCGPPAGQEVAVVDPETGERLPDGRVGEIRVRGANVARRYWRREAIAEWLPTGDLGTLLDGELFVTGRLKDLLIVAGRNHYPQDIEETVGEAAPALGRAAAFTVLVGDEEKAVVVAERSRAAEQWRPEQIAKAVRQAVWRRHDLALHDLVLAEPGTIPRTTSGKVSRTGCRNHYLREKTMVAQDA